MLSTPGGRRPVLKLVARIALGVFLLASACAPLSGAEPEAGPQKPNQPQTEAAAKHLRDVLGSRVTLKLGPAPLKDVLDQVAAKYDIRSSRSTRM